MPDQTMKGLHDVDYNGLAARMLALTGARKPAGHIFALDPGQPPYQQQGSVPVQDRYLIEQMLGGQPPPMRQAPDWSRVIKRPREPAPWAPPETMPRQ
jgi:hypothetical protein